MARPRKDSSPSLSGQTAEQTLALFHENITAIYQWWRDQDTAGPDSAGYYVIMEGAAGIVKEAMDAARMGKKWEPAGYVRK